MSTRVRKEPVRAGLVYVAHVRLTNKAGDVLAEVGETCEKVPQSSLPWLIEQGLIVEQKA